MKNPNDINAKYYDLASSPFKGEAITNEEIGLVGSLVKPKGRILDIGCGSGRHLIPLYRSGFDMTGIDPSEGMLDVLFKKEPELKNTKKIINDTFQNFTFKGHKKNDLIIMFWNTFNEICLTKKEAFRLLKKCIKLLSDEGKILINSDDLMNIDPEDFNFDNAICSERKKILYKWKTVKFNKRTDTSISKESIRVIQDDTIIDRSETMIEQRWWSIENYKKIADHLNLKYSSIELKGNDELYIILENRSKQGGPFNEQ